MNIAFQKENVGNFWEVNFVRSRRRALGPLVAAAVPPSSTTLPISSDPSKSVCQNSFMITAAQKVGIAAGKYQELQLPSCPHQPRSRVPDLVGSRLPSPYHFRARIQSFQGVATPFAGDSVLPSASRAAISATETPRFKRWTIGSAAASSETA